MAYSGGLLVTDSLGFALAVFPPKNEKFITRNKGEPLAKLHVTRVRRTEIASAGGVHAAVFFFH